MNVRPFSMRKVLHFEIMETASIRVGEIVDHTFQPFPSK